MHGDVHLAHWTLYLFCCWDPAAASKQNVCIHTLLHNGSMRLEFAFPCTGVFPADMSLPQKREGDASPATTALQLVTPSSITTQGAAAAGSGGGSGDDTTEPAGISKLKKMKLSIGLGVGLGAGLPIVIFLIVWALVSRKHSVVAPQSIMNHAWCMIAIQQLVRIPHTQLLTHHLIPRTSSEVSNLPLPRQAMIPPLLACSPPVPREINHSDDAPNACM